MAWIEKRGSKFRLSFRFGGRAYHHSLGTADPKEAEACRVRLEDTLNERRAMLGKDPVYLTRFNAPLREAIPAAQTMLPIFDVSPDVETCDEGYCWT